MALPNDKGAGIHMTRRFLSVLLAAVLLAGLLPGAVISASAASAMTTSQEAVTVLKELEGYQKMAYPDNGYYSIGYGTRVNKDDYPDGVSKEEAEALLLKSVATFENSVNAFANENNLTLTQNQFDALVLFTYNLGAEWTKKDNDKSKDIRNAVVSGMTGNEFIFYMTRWCKASEIVNTGLILRRLAEADMYLNGYYASKAPSSFSYVLFDGNGGTYDYTVQGYNAAEPVAVKGKATLSGATFLGWYTAKEGGKWVDTLDASTKAQTLYAHWQLAESGGKDAEGNLVGTTAAYQRIAGDVLNVYAAPSAGAEPSSTVAGGTTVSIVADYLDASGVKWGRLSSSGWIMLSGTKAVVAADAAPNRTNSVTLGASGKNEETGTSSAIAVGTVSSTGYLRVRSGAGTSYAVVTGLAPGTRVEITQIVKSGDAYWGRIDSGWICLTYVKYSMTDGSDSAQKDDGTNPDKETDKGSDGTAGSGNGTDAVQGKVTANSLNVRKGPGTAYAKVTSLNRGSAVTITEQVLQGNVYWGKTEAGWVCMTYIQLDSAEDKTGTEGETGGSSADTSGETIAVTTASNLCVRSGAGTGYSVRSTLPRGSKIVILQQTLVNGTLWGQIETGWVCMNYVKITSGGSNLDYTGIITASNLCIRSGAGTGYAIVSGYSRGERITICELKQVNGTYWARTSKGWVCMNYVQLVESGSTNTGTDKTPDSATEADKDAKQDSQTSTDTNQTPSGGSDSAGDSTRVIGVVTASNLCVRSGAGTDRKVVSSLPKGTEVEILQQTVVNGSVWGQISGGWICMTYVKITSGSGNVHITGTVTARELCVRTGPATTYSIAAGYVKGDAVDILETVSVGATLWGRTEKGWICLNYVKF